MKINLVAAGKINEDYIKKGIEEFSQRLSNYCKLNIIEIEHEHIPQNTKGISDKIKAKEGIRLLEKVPENSYIIALDVKGKPMTSKGLAHSLQNLQVQGRSNITFIIGGPLGLSQEIIAEADYQLSLSHMTFTHQMIRLILLEQLYRAFKIISGEPYHR
ncbi:MAG: 23S rRNA (pseudouridine(1915)-N(3))-methyltransferase RlmH [Bacillota bacterium]